MVHFSDIINGKRILGADEIKTVPETPWSHPFIEGAIGTVRREFLDETLFWGEHDLESKLAEFVIYYNEARFHSSLTDDAPLFGRSYFNDKL